VVHTFEEKIQMLKLIKEHITENVIKVTKNIYQKIGSRFYRQKVGIPQGSVLSTILCK
jgi:telomerase reverse transcriptase